jgi:hypothetical protein
LLARFVHALAQLLVQGPQLLGRAAAVLGLLALGLRLPSDRLGSLAPTLGCGALRLTLPGPTPRQP